MAKIGRIGDQADDDRYDKIIGCFAELEKRHFLCLGVDLIKMGEHDTGFDLVFGFDVETQLVDKVLGIDGGHGIPFHS